MKVGLAFLFVIFCISCTEKDMSTHLRTGLNEYVIKRKLNLSFVDNYTVKSIAFFNTESQQQLVLEMNENVSQQTIDKYMLGVHGYKEGITSMLVWNYKPELQKFGKYTYIITNVKTPIVRLDSMRLFLYQREGYKHVIGNMIRIKNIKL